jgi:hypothetical protein
MVGHQTVAQQRQAELAAALREKGQVDLAVAVAEEDSLAVIPPLRDVVRRTHRDHASKPWHPLSVAQLPPLVKAAPPIS